MVLRITRDEKPPHVTLRLEGRLIGAWSQLLERECASLLGTIETLTVDLSGVGLIDSSAVAVLGRLQRSGVAITGCSDVVASILESEGIPIR